MPLDLEGLHAFRQLPSPHGGRHVVTAPPLRPLPLQAGKLLPCSHVVHASCLGAWLQQSCACPLCRADLDVSTKEPTKQQQMTAPRRWLRQLSGAARVQAHAAAPRPRGPAEAAEGGASHRIQRRRAPAAAVSGSGAALSGSQHHYCTRLQARLAAGGAAPHSAGAGGQHASRRGRRADAILEC